MYYIITYTLNGTSDKRTILAEGDSEQEAIEDAVKMIRLNSKELITIISIDREVEEEYTTRCYNLTMGDDDDE